MIDAAKRPSFELPLDKLNVLAPAPIEDDAKNKPSPPSRRDNLLGFGRRSGQRFLDHDVLAGLKSRPSNRKVEEIGHGNRDRIDIWIGEEVLVIAIHARDGELPREFTTAVLVEAGNSQHPDSRIKSESL